MIGIFTNLLRDKEAKAALFFSEELKKRDTAFLVCDNAAAYFDKHLVADIDSVCHKCDSIVVFGGDGTIISVIRNAVKYDKPILGVNLGNVGFLTEADVGDLSYIADQLLKKKYSIEKRTMLQVQFDGKKWYALNEILVGRNNFHIVHVEVYIDGVLSDKVNADGVMVSTPTGSTAYSLSCGGPILSPDVGGFIVNQICPHSLHSRPMVIADHHVITLKPIFKGDKHTAQAVVDGRIVASIGNSVSVVVKKAKKTADFIKLKDENFYNRLLKKLNYWSVVNIGE